MWLYENRPHKYVPISKYLELALNERKNINLKKKRVEEAFKNDWEIRIREFIDIINHE